jgi:hypothetical protein
MTKRKDSQPDAVEAEAVEPAADGPVADGPVADGPVAVAEPPVIEPELAEPPLAQNPPAPPRRLGVLGPVLGGALAAAGGFALSHFDILGIAAPDQSAEVTTLTKRLDEVLSGQELALKEVSGELAAITARVEKLESAPVPEMPDLPKLDELDRRLTVIETLPAEGGASNAALTAKLAELERRLATRPEGAPAELQADLDAALERLNAAEAAATARATEAEIAAAAAKRGQALDGLAEIVAAGRPFVAELEALGDPALIEALGPMAEAGVPTLARLQADFPAAARDALMIAREVSTEDGWGDRLMDFLAAQTGARSLTPREGDDPDAVLSRAEFALSEGRVADAVAEFAPMDPAVMAPLDSWIADAKAHLAAAAALQAARGE